VIRAQYCWLFVKFCKIQPRDGDILVMGLNEVTLTLNLGTVRHSESQEDLGKVCVNASRSASLLVLFQASFNSGRQALTILPSDAPEFRAYYDDFSTIFTVPTVVPTEKHCTQVPKTVGLLFKNACTIIFTNILQFNTTVL
jgi:hypothetical protein